MKKILLLFAILWVSVYNLNAQPMNGNWKSSHAKLVLGINTKSGIMIYPNPVVNGRTKVLFTDPGVIHEVTLFDMQGKLLKKWNNVVQEDLVIENLSSGLYILQVINKEANEINNIRITVINK